MKSGVRKKIVKINQMCKKSRFALNDQIGKKATIPNKL